MKFEKHSSMPFFPVPHALCIGRNLSNPVKLDWSSDDSLSQPMFETFAQNVAAGDVAYRPHFL